MKPKVKMTVEEFVKLNTIEQEVKKSIFQRLNDSFEKFYDSVSNVLFDYKISIFRH